jgi:hypothetical protein
MLCSKIRKLTYLVITTLDIIVLVSLEKCSKYEARESTNIRGRLLLADLSLDHLRRFYVTNHKEVYSIH